MGKKKGGGGVRIKQVGPTKQQKAAMNMGNPMEDLMVPPEDMVNLPPPPNRNFQIFWPIHEILTMKTDDFITIYPSYLDSSKTIQQGRRIGKDKAVDTPTVTDISQVLQQLGLRHVVQPHKGYPRDTHTLWDNPGRVKVERPADRVPKITEITDETDLENSEPGGGCKRKLLSDIAERIPSLPSRIQRLAQEAKTRQEAQDKRQEELQALQKQQHRQPSAPGNAKKKGKKKR